MCMDTDPSWRSLGDLPAQKKMEISLNKVGTTRLLLRRSNTAHKSLPIIVTGLKTDVKSIVSL